MSGPAPASPPRRLVNRVPPRRIAVLLGVAPFVLLAALYLSASALRQRDNPNDRLLPPIASLAAAIHDYALVEDPRSGDILLWTDTLASLERIGIALAISAAAGLVLGVLLGVVPYLRAAAVPLLGAIAMVPPLAILPILFIVVGLGEAAKITLIVIGIAPVLARDLALRAAELPREQLIKAQTLGASTLTLSLRIVVPQLGPRLLDALRLSLGSAWLFLIAAEAIASTEGLGYRIFLVRRYMAMDVILPYVAWITILALVMDGTLRALRRWAFPWAEPGR